MLFRRVLRMYRFYKNLESENVNSGVYGQKEEQNDVMEAEYKILGDDELS